MSDATLKRWNDWVMPYYEALRLDWPVPGDIEVLDPYGKEAIRHLRHTFYNTYYDDCAPRQIWLGINPGRIGAGRTGIPFSDAVQLRTHCGLRAPGPQSEELSAAFIFEVIAAAGGADSFYRRVFVDSVSPMGYVKEGVNCNYYDEVALFDHLRPRLENHLSELLKRPIAGPLVLLGKGKNLKYFKKLYTGDREIVALPHPRWVMQYRRKEKDKWIDRYLAVLSL